MDGGFEPENKRAVILGAGGAARAVSLALLSEKVGPLAIANRTLKRAEALVDSLAKYAGAGGTEAELHALSWHGPELREAIRNCHLVVNCTTLGMKYASQAGQFPLEADWISAGVLVYDLVYNPPETPLLKMAQKAGARALGGLPMLVYQGAASFSLWTGREAPVDIMFSAARKALSAEC